MQSSNVSRFLMAHRVGPPILLRLQGRQVGFEASLSLSGMTISLR